MEGDNFGFNIDDISHVNHVIEALKRSVSIFIESFQ